MIDPQTETIDGITYKAGKWPAKRSLENLRILGRYLGDGVLTAVAQAKMSDDQNSAVVALVASICEELKENEAESIIRKLLADVHEDGQDRPVTEDFDLRFAGKMLHLFKVVAFAVRTNYSDFLAGGLALA